MFVVMALVTTVATTPLTSLLYPPSYQKKLEAWKRGEIHWDGTRLDPDADPSGEKLKSTTVSRLLVYLRLDSLPSVFTFVGLLGGGTEAPNPQLRVYGVRLLELTERTSSVMKSSEADEYTAHDPVVNAFRTFAQLNRVPASGDVSIVSESSYASTIIGKASDMSSDLMLIPWSENGTVSEGDQSHFMHEGSSINRFSNGSQMSFVQNVLDTAKCNAVVFINRGFSDSPIQDARSLKRTVSGISIHREVTVSPATDLKRHICLPYFGSADDQVALRLLIQLAHNINITASVIHVKAIPGTEESSTQSESGFLHSIRDSLPATLTSRVSFLENSTSSNLSGWFESNEVPQSPKIGDLIIVGRNKGASHVVTERLARMTSGPDLRRTLGAAAECILYAGVKASILVVQAPTAS